jgi:integrase
MAEATKRERVKLTDTRVHAMRAEGSVYRVWDSVVPGFLVRVTPAGAKAYCVAFQRTDGQKVNVTIGDAKVWKVEAAREKAAELRKLHEQGKDARAHHQGERAPQDLAALVKVWEADYKPSLKDSTRSACASRVKILTKFLGSRLVKDLSLADVKALHRKILNRDEGEKHVVNANRVVAMLSRLLTIAEKEGWRPMGTNPCRQFEKPSEQSRDRIFSSEELAKLETGIRGLVKVKNLDPQAGDLFRFLALSGLRKGEALGLRFADVDLDRGLMRFEDHKTAEKSGVKVLPLNSHLKVIIKRNAALRLGPFIFSGWVDNGPIVGVGKMWDRLLVAAGVADITPHDLRRTFMTTCTELGYPMTIGDALLGHSLGKIRDTYVNLGSEGIMATASQETADWIAAAMEGKPVRAGVKFVPDESSRASLA